jgi:hypothetical protein
MRATNVRNFQNFHVNFIYILRTFGVMKTIFFFTFSNIPNLEGNLHKNELFNFVILFLFNFV